MCGRAWRPPSTRPLSLVSILLVSWSLAAGAPVAEAREDAAATRGQDRYVVVYNAGPHRRGFSVSAETTKREDALGFSSYVRFRHALKGFATELSPEAVRTLRRDPEVALVSPDRQIQIARAPLASGEQLPSGVPRIGAATGGTVFEPSHTAVAMLDTGIDVTHSDLNAEAGVNCIGSGPPVDDNGHGTHTAGIVGARNNGSGVVGVAPGTRVISVKVLDAAGAGLASELICGIDWVTAHAASRNIRAANLSLGEVGLRSTCQTDALHLAICNSTNAGVTYTVAAGNDARGIGTVPVQVPASYPEVLAVTAMSDTDGQPGAVGGVPTCADGAGQADDRFATFSNYALSEADAGHVIAAPGVCIRSTVLGGGYAAFSGTSAAAPHVAGTIALCFDEGGRGGPCAGLRPAQVIQKLREDAARDAAPGNGFRGDPNSSIGFYYGFLVSPVESTKPLPPALVTARIESGPPPDRTVSFRVLRLRSRRDRVYVVARMDEPGTLTARGSVNLSGGAARALRFRRVTKRVVTPKTVKLKLTLGRRPGRLVRQALRRNRRLKARLVLKGRDQAGNSSVVRRSLKLTR